MPKDNRRKQLQTMCDDAIDFWSNLALCADTPAFRMACAEAQSMAIAIDGVTDLRVLKAYKDNIEEGLRHEQPAANIRESLIHDLGEDAASLPGLSFLRPGSAVKASEVRKPLTNEQCGRLDQAIRTNLIRARSAGRWRRLLWEAGIEQRGKLPREDVTGVIMPYGLYHVPDDSKEAGACSSHSFLDGLVLPLDDERWVDFWPPNRFDCGCSVEVVDRAAAAKNGLSPTPCEDVPDKHDIPDREFQHGFTAAERPSLPYADYLAEILKSKSYDFTPTKRNNLAVSWHCDEKLGKALEKRFQDGLKVFARQEEEKVSCGEMSINIDVFPNRYPSGVTGHLATITDSGYQSVFRDLAVKLDQKKSDRGLPATGKNMSEGELERLARMIMKKIPQGLRTGDYSDPTEAGFEIRVLHGMVTLGFEKRESDDRLFYLLKEVAEIRKPPQEIKGWFDERFGKGEVTVERPV